MFQNWRQETKFLSSGIRNLRQQLLDLCIIHTTSVRLLFANRNSDSTNFISWNIEIERKVWNLQHWEHEIANEPPSDSYLKCNTLRISFWKRSSGLLLSINLFFLMKIQITNLDCKSLISNLIRTRNRNFQSNLFMAIQFSLS